MTSTGIFLVVFGGSSIIPLVFTNSEKVQDMSSGLLKLIALILFLDATQVKNKLDIEKSFDFCILVVHFMK
jgi:hypothetical protein